MDLKTNYLLEVSLETLHFETTEWTEEAKFYFDELTLFRDMITHKSVRNALERQIITDVILNINTLLDKITHAILKELATHEKYLSGLLSTKIVGSEQEYRKKHELLSKKMKKLKNLSMDVKKRVYQVFRKNQFKNRHHFEYTHSSLKV